MATSPTLRPLGVVEVLDAGIKLYLSHWKPLVTCAAVAVVPVQVLSLLALASTGTGTGTTTTSQQVDTAGLSVVFTVSLAAALSWVLSLAACSKAVADARIGSAPTAGGSLRFALARGPRLLWLFIVLSFWLTLAFCALFVPFVWLGVAWSLSVPVLLFERVGAWRALSRSFRLTRGRWWTVFGALVVMVLLRLVVWLVVQVLPSAAAAAVASDSDLASAIAQTVGSTISLVITTPFAAAVLTLLYLDLRGRQEGPDPHEERVWWRDPTPEGPAVGAGEARYGGGYAGPRAPSPGGGSGSRSSAERGGKRAEWLPPEAPRGPEGL